jgi:hypothetical protein
MLGVWWITFDDKPGFSRFPDVFFGQLGPEKESPLLSG